MRNNVSSELFKGLNDAGYDGYFTDAWLDETAYEVGNATDRHTHFVIYKRDDIGGLLTVKLPTRKFISAGYLIGRYASRRGKQFKNLSHLVSEIVDLAIDVYPASYGIGIVSIYNPLKDKQLGHITSVLDTADIEYNVEYSDARWVCRIKISKVAGNLERLQRLAQ